MKLSTNDRGGILLTLIIIGIIMFVGYVVFNNFMESEQGQEIQDTTNTIIDTVENVNETINQASDTIDQVTN